MRERSARRRRHREPPRLLALWLDGLLFGFAGVALPMLSVLLIGIGGLALRETQHGLSLLLWLSLPIVAPWLTLAVIRLTGLRVARLDGFLQPRGVGAGAEWWLGLRWLLVIWGAAACGRYLIRVPVEALTDIVLSQLSGLLGDGWRRVLRIASFALLELPLWGLLARGLGASLPWRAGRRPERPTPPMPAHDV
jgi:hypothetical protein